MKTKSAREKKANNSEEIISQQIPVKKKRKLAIFEGKGTIKFHGHWKITELEF